MEPSTEMGKDRDEQVGVWVEFRVRDDKLFWIW